MRSAFAACLLSAMALTPASAGEGGFAKPTLVIEQPVAGMPSGSAQSVRVLTATFKPGDRTVPHTHRYPVTVYVLEGAFTLEVKGEQPVIVKAGEAMVEPADSEMIGYNRTDGETRVVIFYLSKPAEPFLDAMK
ncbi:cupin domain-containing protein [Mesorhizobium sp. NBSH29]|uniref:cupin domain-containing protein n=1 Tax=Mesorhizobium sp. NBSH29 TaxID=2654249 RepID=UPI00189688C0|nr:cupin domain-containing protein [Mesorhizobium sp. NBSH29]QPC85442.1 cupin domain-containing protein [Mesorhizobium sp. NBSH29]